MDPITNEPLFTNCTRDFIGTLDYIFYTGVDLQLDFIINMFLCRMIITIREACLQKTLLNYVTAADTLTVESLLELLDEGSLRKDTALPSPEWSSDHIALLAEFHCKPRPRR